MLCAPVRYIKKTILLTVILSITYGCSAAPVPAEIKAAQRQEHEIWRAGAEVYASEEYTNYKTALRNAKDLLIKETSKFAWFRNYEPVQTDFRDVLLQGEQILKKIQEEKIKGIPPYTAAAIESILPIISRYADRSQITKWQSWVNETIEESKTENIPAIVVSKIDRKL